MAAACGGGGATDGNGEPWTLDTSIVYQKHRDDSGNIAAVLLESGSGFDAAEVDSPSVVVDVERPSQDAFLLYYEATGAGGTSSIGMVSSASDDFADLVVNRTEVVPRGGAGSRYDIAATDPSVLVDAAVPYGSDGRYEMWFEGRSGSGGVVSSILYGTSGDGIAWSDFTICSGLDASFASERVADPTVIKDGATYKMWFEAVGGSDGSGSLGYAESTNGFHWRVRDGSDAIGMDASPVFGPGNAGSFYGYSVNAPSVVLDETVDVGVQGRYLLWFEAGDSSADTQNTIGFSVSADGWIWSAPSGPVLLPSSDVLTPLPFDSGDLEHPSALIVDTVDADVSGHFLLWYTGDGENNVTPNRIGFARGRLGP